MNTTAKRATALLAAFGLLLAACQQPAAQPTAAPAKPAAPAATTAPAKPAEAAKPAASPAAAAKPAASPAAAAASPAAKPAASPAAGGAAKPGGAAASKPAMDPGPCVAANANKPVPSGKARLVIGTGGTGGVFFPYGGGLARILTAKMPNTEMTAEVTGGSVDNMKLINSGEADVGMSTVDSAYDAFMGTGAYQDTGKIPACTIATLYQSFVHVVALDGSGVTTVESMKGKRISVGSAGSSTEGAADRILEAAGLNPRTDITRDNLSVAESVAAMKDRKIDAFFWIGGLPTAAVTDLVATPGLKANFIDTSRYVEPMRQKYGPIYAAFTLPQGVYAGVPATPGIGIGNILFVNANLNQDLVATMLKTIFDNLEEVKTIHPEARSLTIESAAANSSIPFHPGAIRFYTERGVWKGQ